MDDDDLDDDDVLRLIMQRDVAHRERAELLDEQSVAGDQRRAAIFDSLIEAARAGRLPEGVIPGVLAALKDLEERERPVFEAKRALLERTAELGRLLSGDTERQ